MKNKSKTFLFVLFAVVLLFSGTTASAVSEPGEKIRSGIFSALEVDDLQTWLDGELTESAGSTAEWSVFALSQLGTFDYSSYQKALLEFLNTHQVYSATSREKYALVLAATGMENEIIPHTMRDSIGVQGHMSWVFGLHFYNNGFSIPEFTAEDLVREIRSHQLSDGGFAVIGDHGDPDVTAMTLQALAPYRDDPELSQDFDRAFSFLSGVQLPDGGFSSMGTVNAESCCQVILCLTEWGIDPNKDPRFLKNGKSPLDALLSFQTDRGDFAHEIAGPSNQSATVQALYTSVALTRFSQGKRLFDLDRAKPMTVLNWPDSEPDKTDTTDPGKGDPPSLFTKQKILILAGLFLPSALLTLWILLSRKRKRDLILVWGVFFLASLAVLFLKIQSKEDFYAEDTTKGEKIGICMISIRCDTLLDHVSDLDPDLISRKWIPENGEIFPVTLVDLYRGDSVYDILDRVCRKEKLQLEVMGASQSRLGTVYVEGIGHLYEASCGPLSGWMFRVNGEFPLVSSSECILRDGDVIEWAYTCDLGHDIGNFYRGEKS